MADVDDIADRPNPDELAELDALLTFDWLDSPDSQALDTLPNPSDSGSPPSSLIPALDALPYGVPLQPITADLKDRLFRRIALETPLIESELYALLSLPISELIVRSQTLSWQPMLSTAMEIAFLQVDEIKQQMAFFVRAMTGGEFPKHWHAAGEEVVVLSGDFIVEGKPHRAGDRIFSPANTTHQPQTQQGCLLFCVSSVNDEMLA